VINVTGVRMIGISPTSDEELVFITGRCLNPYEIGSIVSLDVLQFKDNTILGYTIREVISNCCNKFVYSVEECVEYSHTFYRIELLGKRL
jgi:hypothetical protein